MPYNDLLPDSMPELPTHFTVAPPPTDPPMPKRKPPKHAFRPPQTPGLCRLSGRARSRWGLPVSDATVSLCPESDPRNPIASTRTDCHGAFHFTHLRPGCYTLVAHRRHRRGKKKVCLSHRDCNRRDISITVS